jgi:hypothetical protein
VWCTVCVFCCFVVCASVNCCFVIILYRVVCDAICTGLSGSALALRDVGVLCIVYCVVLLLCLYLYLCLCIYLYICIFVCVFALFVVWRVCVCW